MTGDIRFQRKLMEQGFAKGVNRLDFQTTRRFQGLGEEPPCGRKCRPVRLFLFDCGDALRELGVIQRRPFGEPLEHAVRHFRRGRLGIGQAQDRGGAGAGEQQTDHALCQDMRLARARIGGHPGRLAGI